jgi:Protein of unknown function VcgC/VcgE (DUF2780)
MADLVDSLAAQVGISPELAHKGLASLLSFLKTELGDEHFSRLESSVPGAAGMADQAEPAPGQGGILGAVTALAGKLLGDKAAGGAKLLESLGALGLDPQQIEAFVVKAIAQIRQHIPSDLLEKVKASLPALAGLAPSEPVGSAPSE